MPTEYEKGLKMAALARTFPGLRSKFGDAADNGLDPWDFARLAEASRPWSTGEKLVVAFLGQVWNSDDAYELVGHFSVVNALKRLDPDNWAAFAKWAQDPFHC